MAWKMPEPDASPREVVQELRRGAFLALIYANVVDEQDKAGAARAREDACRLRCEAAVIEAMSTLYDELGLQAERWGAFAQELNEHYKNQAARNGWVHHG